MTVDMNIEERLWGIGIKAQQMLAWRMFDDDDDWLYKGNMRVYDDLLIQVTEEQFIDRL